MKKIIIKGTVSDSQILIGESVRNISSYLPVGESIIITDSEVNRLYGSLFKKYKVIEIGRGEAIKNSDTVNYIYNKLLNLKADRKTFIIGIGGGIICDIAGFVAATYRRGLRFGVVATTLLAQVDASIGGKNGINFKGYKNIIGTITQPEFVICASEMLKTLPQKELLNGFAEIVKHALIADSKYFNYIKDNYKKALDLNKGVIEELVYKSALIKSEIVNRDERETGERRKLNFGHTIGHALEKNYPLVHGQAVSIGMVAAARLSVQKGLLTTNDYLKIESTLKMLGLPIEYHFNSKKIINAIRKDKKKEGGDIHFILLNKIGNAVIVKIKLKELEEVIDDLC
ncbi:MAG: 3-dehydroquinate synthase [Bacteroidia bacterium]|nr:3-dehydroquinate synthase [Bacteroidia bacterium]